MSGVETLNKPPYYIPSMEEIASISDNGFNVVSTFSGCGGSCLGFKMAGFKVLWANEFIPAAQEVYRINHPEVILSTDDIRKVQPEDILRSIQLQKGEIDVVEGSPPCASFSSSGRRDRTWGQIKKYSDTKQRTDDLFFEFIRVVEGLQPRVFVAENVSGLVRGRAKGYFKEILKGLRDCGYKVEAKLLDAQWLGVPQHRERVIFIGVRNDLNKDPEFPFPLPYRYSLKDAIPNIIRERYADGSWRLSNKPAATVLQSGSSVSLSAKMNGGGYIEIETDISGSCIGVEYDKIKSGEGSKKYQNLLKASWDRPSPTVTQAGGHKGTAAVVHPTEKRKYSIQELKRICSFPEDFKLTGTFEQKWERLGRAVPPLMMKAIAEIIRDKVL